MLMPFLAYFLWLAFTSDPAALCVVASLGFLIAYLATVRLVLTDSTLTMHRLFVRQWSVPASNDHIAIIEGSGWPQLCVRFKGKQWCVSTGQFDLNQLQVLVAALEQDSTSEI